jgi:hypothetical protein
MTRLTIAIAAAAALICLNVRPSHAQYTGNAPWCAVIELGTGDVEWDCEYATAEACAPNVVAGNRGFCNLNPYYVGGYSPQLPHQIVPAPHWRHYVRRHRHERRSPTTQP